MAKGNALLTHRSGRCTRNITTAVCSLEVEWMNASTSWVPLKELKESNLVETTEYAVANLIHDEPAFAWWVKDVLRKRDRILAKVKSRYWSRTQK